MSNQQGFSAKELDHIFRNIVQTRAGGRVERCHSMAHQSSYSNAAHQWGVLVLLWFLFPEDFPRLAPVAMSHDVGEAWVGDIPAPTMVFVPGVRKMTSQLEGIICEDIGLPREDALSPEDLAKVKACDRLELYLWAKEELLKGNQFMQSCVDELEGYLDGPIAAAMPLRARKYYEIVRDRPLFTLLPVQAGIVREAAKRLQTES